MKLLMRDEAKGREHTIFVTIFSALMVMLAIVVMLMASATAISGVTLQLDENAVDILDKQVENRAGYIQDQLQQAQELTDLSTYINETAQQMLDDETLSLKTLDSSSSDSLPLLLAAAPRMLETLRSKRITGIFLILNTHDFTGRTSGDRLPCVYLRDLDPDAALELYWNNLHLPEIHPSGNSLLHLIPQLQPKPKTAFIWMSSPAPCRIFPEVSSS